MCRLAVIAVVTASLSGCVAAPSAHETHADTPEAIAQCIASSLSRKVTADFIDIPAEEAVNFLQALSKVNTVACFGDEIGASKVTLFLFEEPLWRGFDRVCAESKTAWTIAPFEGLTCMQIDVPANIREIERKHPRSAQAMAEFRKKHPAPMAHHEMAKRILKSLDKRLLTVEFDGTPLTEAVNFLQTVSHVNCTTLFFPGGKEPVVNLKIKDEPIWRCFDLVSKAVGAEWTIAPHEGWACPQVESPARIRELKRKHPGCARVMAEFRKTHPARP